MVFLKFYKLKEIYLRNIYIEFKIRKIALSSQRYVQITHTSLYFVKDTHLSWSVTHTSFYFTKLRECHLK